MSKIVLKELPNTVVHCPDRETYDKLMQIYEAAGWEWCDHARPTSEPFKKRSPFIECRNIFYRSDEPVITEKAITFQDFLREQGLDKLKPEDLKAGDWVEVMESFIPNGCSTEYFKKGDICKVKYVNGSVDLWESDGSDYWAVTLHVHKLRKCSPPEEKKEEQFVPPRACDGLNIYTESPKKEEPKIACGGYILPVDFGTHITRYFTTQPSKPLPPSSMSIVDLYRNSALSAEERKLRKAGVKDSFGLLTGEGKALLLEILADQFKTELVKEAKKIIKARKGGDDEDAE